MEDSDSEILNAIELKTFVKWEQLKINYKKLIFNIKLGWTLRIQFLQSFEKASMKALETFSLKSL